MSIGTPYTLTRLSPPGYEHWRPHWYADEGCYKLVIRYHPRLPYDKAKLVKNEVCTPSLEVAVELVRRGLSIRMSNPDNPKENGIINPVNTMAVPL